MKELDYTAPTSLADAIAIFQDKGDRARPLAGGTDLIVQVRENRRDIDVLVDVKRIPELNELSFDRDKGLTIGAAVPCCLVCEHREIAKAYPGLIDAVGVIGGTQIQSRASLGGNLCNASPAADAVPALVALRVECHITGPQGTRTLPVEQFCTAPGKTVLARGEFLVRLTFPAPAPRSGAAYLRFIPRNEMDIAVVGVGVSVELDAVKNAITSARVALGAVAPTVLVAAEAENALVGPLGQDAVDRAVQAARAAARPISDMRGDADYRRHLVGVLLQRTLAIALERAKNA